MLIFGMGGYNTWSDFIRKKATRLLVPLFFWGIIECLIDVPFTIETLVSGPLHLWFLRFLFEAFIITKLLDRYLINKPRVTLIICAFVFFLKTLYHVDSYNHLYHIFKLYPYMLCGIALYSLNKSKLYSTDSLLKVLIIIGAFVGLLLSTFYKHFETPTAIIFLLSLFMGVMAIRFEKDLPSVVYSFDRCSMGIYLMHHPILWNIAKCSYTRSIMYEFPVIAPFVTVTLVILITWGATLIIQKNKYFKYIIG